MGSFVLVEFIEGFVKDITPAEYLREFFSSREPLIAPIKIRLKSHKDGNNMPRTDIKFVHHMTK